MLPAIGAKDCAIALINHSLPYLADLGFVNVLHMKQALAINPEPAVTAKRTALNAHIQHLPMIFDKRPAISNMAERRVSGGSRPLPH